MRYRDSIFANLLKALPRRRFERIVARHGGDRYVKSLRTWTQLVAMVFAQLESASSLKGLVASWNANAHHHYHLGVGAIRRSTLAEASQCPLPAIRFSELIGASLFIRRAIERIDKPPDRQTKIAHANPNQLGFPI